MKLRLVEGFVDEKMVFLDYMSEYSSVEDESRRSERVKEIVFDVMTAFSFSAYLTNISLVEEFCR